MGLHELSCAADSSPLRAPAREPVRQYGRRELAGFWRLNVFHFLVPAILLSLAGCTTRYSDPTPPGDRALHEVQFDSPLSVERSMRVLYAGLNECVGSTYHVQPRFARDEGKAWVMVVSGLGLNRYSVLGNLFEARFDISKAAVGSLVRVSYHKPLFASIVDASRGWLSDGARGC